MLMKSLNNEHLKEQKVTFSSPVCSFLPRCQTVSGIIGNFRG